MLTPAEPPAQRTPYLVYVRRTLPLLTAAFLRRLPLRAWFVPVVLFL